jgi:hypothetical protein
MWRYGNGKAKKGYTVALHGIRAGKEVYRGKDGTAWYKKYGSISS